MSNIVELVLIPVPGMGHILSNVELAKLIIRRNECISILIINLPSRSPRVNACIDSQLRDSSNPSRLSFVSITPFDLPDDPSSSFPSVIELYKPHVKRVIEDRIKSGLPKPAGFVFNMWCTCMVDIANELNVPSYLFFTSGASFLNLVFYTLSLAYEEGIDVATEFSDPGFTAVVPGFKNPVTSAVIPGMFQQKEFMNETLLNLLKRLREMKGILVNTYIELESFAIQALLSTDDRNIPPIYPVGPVLALDNKSRGSSDDEKESLMAWLDGQPRSSVVFICFGSIGSFYEEQVKEIANALDRSEHCFLWALRMSPLEGNKPRTSRNNESFLDALPEGFIDRTANKGRIMSWAPQVEVLAHPSVGGFVSHCGWNSTLECMWFGVPMATWPLQAEQQINAFELVKELEIAVELKLDYNASSKCIKGNFLVTAEDIEKGINKLMCIDEKMKENIKDVSNKGRMALEEGGSSYIWLGCFIENVLSNVACSRPSSKVVM